MFLKKENELKMEKNNKQKCICCNKEQIVLISVQTNHHSFFLQRRTGVCQQCLKEKDINSICKEYELKEVTESIRQTEETLESLHEDKQEIEGNYEVK